MGNATQPNATELKAASWRLLTVAPIEANQGQMGPGFPRRRVLPSRLQGQGRTDAVTTSTAFRPVWCVSPTPRMRKASLVLGRFRLTDKGLPGLRRALRVMGKLQLGRVGRAAS